MKHVTEEQLVGYHYSDGDDESRRAIEEHLASCASCREGLSAIKGVLTAVDSAAVPERGEGYGAEVWRRLAPRLGPGPVEHERPRGWLLIFHPPQWLSPRAWAPAAVVALLVVVAFFLGRYSPRPAAPVAQAQPASAEVRDRILLVAVGDHLERSQMVLVELENARGAGRVNISAERERAEDLVAANRLYRQTAAQAGEAGVASVLDELERVLIEIAHSPAEVSQAQLDEIRHRIEARGILFKVRIIDSQVQQRGRERIAPANAPGGKS